MSTFLVVSGGGGARSVLEGCPAFFEALDQGLRL